MKSKSYLNKGIVAHRYWIIVGNYKDLLKKYPKTHVLKYSQVGEYVKKGIRDGKKRIKVRRLNPYMRDRAGASGPRRYVVDADKRKK